MIKVGGGMQTNELSSLSLSPLYFIHHVGIAIQVANAFPPPSFPKKPHLRGGNTSHIPPWGGRVNIIYTIHVF